MVNNTEMFRRLDCITVKHPQYAWAHMKAALQRSGSPWSPDCHRWCECCCGGVGLHNSGYGKKNNFKKRIQHGDVSVSGRNQSLILLLSWGLNMLYLFPLLLFRLLPSYCFTFREVCSVASVCLYNPWQKGPSYTQHTAQRMICN